MTDDKVVNDIKFTNTAAALIVYDATAAARDAAWHAAMTNEDVYACQLADLDAAIPVRKAYWADTRDRNSLQCCMQVDLGFMRQVYMAKVRWVDADTNTDAGTGK